MAVWVQVSSHETDSRAGSCLDTVHRAEQISGTQVQAPSVPVFLVSSVPPGLPPAQGRTEDPAVCIAGSCRSSRTQAPQLIPHALAHPVLECLVFTSPHRPTILACPVPTGRTSTVVAAMPVRRREGTSSSALPPTPPQLHCPNLPEAHWIPPHPRSYSNSSKD